MLGAGPSGVRGGPIPAPSLENSGLAIIDSDLTTVGGEDGAGRRTSKLFTLRQGKLAAYYFRAIVLLAKKLVF